MCWFWVCPGALEINPNVKSVAFNCCSFFKPFPFSEEISHLNTTTDRLHGVKRTRFTLGPSLLPLITTFLIAYILGLTLGWQLGLAIVITATVLYLILCGELDFSVISIQNVSKFLITSFRNLVIGRKLLNQRFLFKGLLHEAGFENGDCSTCAKQIDTSIRDPYWQDSVARGHREEYKLVWMVADASSPQSSFSYWLTGELKWCGRGCIFVCCNSPAEHIDKLVTWPQGFA